jgi:membrane-associated protein
MRPDLYFYFYPQIYKGKFAEELMVGVSIILDFILHVDKYLTLIIQSFGWLVYFILFGIIFLETGLVITPFFPGDSLIFVSGAFAAVGSMNIFILFFVFLLAAILGDSANYFIGKYFGVSVFEKYRLFSKEHLDKTQKFYEKHGGKTIIYARFIPFIRTFAPFVAGIGKMKYSKFISFNIIGAFLWVTLFLLAGFFFGTIPIIKNNLTSVIYIIIALSLIPPIIEFFSHRKK